MDFASGIARLDPVAQRTHEGFTVLATRYDTYILSTAPGKNPTAWSDSLLWVQQWFGVGENSPAYQRLILSHHKQLLQGTFIIDDRTKRGVDEFEGVHLHFGADPRFLDWRAVVAYLREHAARTA